MVTKAQILGNVWDFDFEGDPNIVEVYIARLRRKIDQPFGRDDHRDPPRAAATASRPRRPECARRAARSPRPGDRVTTVAAAVVLAATLVGSGLFVLTLRSSLEAGLVSNARQEIADDQRSAQRTGSARSRSR